MQNSILNIAEELEGAGQIDSHLSFKGFIQFLKERKKYEKTMKAKFLDFVITTFEQRLQGKDTLSLEEIGQYEDLSQLVYAVIFPAIEDEQDHYWGLSLPIKPVIFYGTDPYYDMVRDPETCKFRTSFIKDKEKNKINLEFIYSFLLKNLYKLKLPARSFIRSFMDPRTGKAKFFKLNIDTRFVEIIPKGPLPDIRPDKIHLHEPAVLDYLVQQLPLSLFRFEGISAITVKDITTDYALENIKNIILDRSSCTKDQYYNQIIESLKVLTGKDEVELGLLPILKINGKPVFVDSPVWHSLLAAAASDEGEAMYMSMAENYIREPRLLFFPAVGEPGEENEKMFFLQSLKKAGVKAYALIPVFYGSQLAGVLEIYSRKEGALDHEVLSRMDIVLPVVAQLLQRTIDDFDNKIKAIVKENFTSIQPAVEWKFNEAAWKFIKDYHRNEGKPVLETIYFKDVFPLYGAIDIRNSTIERNNALRQDLQTHLEILKGTLSELHKQMPLGLLEELIYRCEKWENALSLPLTTSQELEINSFLKNDAGIFLTHFRESRPEMAGIINAYFMATDEVEGIAFTKRREMETSMQQINATINRHLEESIGELQHPYPYYFEKFRTDGVEYDIYIGQSIAPDQPFDLLYLKNLRLWQLKSMATIARLAHQLLPGMPEKLQTTQLIFVHSNPIDISFRKDERRFDVEGGYNIRYQVVKKRIDKVHLKGGIERLTQPGKIAVIYFNEKEAEEYVAFIKYLQGKQVLEEDLERVELEDLQGVSGLRALRVGVRLD